MNYLKTDTHRNTGINNYIPKAIHTERTKDDTESDKQKDRANERTKQYRYREK